MIRYALKCPDDHTFESWFQSAEAYDTLCRSGLVTCPDCGSADIVKALMAPPVQVTRSRRAPKPDTPGTTDLPAAPDKQSRLAALKAHVEANSEYVGVNFAAEARAMHVGDRPERSIYGEAKLEDARALVEDGVPVAPLPFVPTRRAN